jgi:hypothetical protein
LEVSKAGGVEKIAKFQSPIVASLDVCFHILSLDLGKNKPRSRPSHDIEREFAEKGIHGGPFHGIQKCNIPIGSDSKFHKLFKSNMRGATFSRETMTSFFEKFLETGIFSVMINL